jgi:predicted nucleic acid-binding Zn ribbon protein
MGAGTMIMENSHSSPQSPKFCPECGKPLNENAEICTGCGVRLKTPPQKTGLLPWLIAILIILIIIFFAYVFMFLFFASSLGEEHWDTRSVAATARHIGTDIEVTWQGGSDNILVTNYNITVWNATSFSGVIVVPDNVVGNRTKVLGIGAGGDQTHVLVVAYFTDGSQQVVLNTYV